MPAFTERQISDEELDSVAQYIASLPYEGHAHPVDVDLTAAVEMHLWVALEALEVDDTAEGTHHVKHIIELLDPGVHRTQMEAILESLRAGETHDQQREIERMLGGTAAPDLTPLQLYLRQALVSLAIADLADAQHHVAHAQGLADVSQEERTADILLLLDQGDARGAEHEIGELLGEEVEHHHEFEEVTLRAGIDFNHHHPRQVRFPAGAGVVVFDFNNDGFEDIYIGNSIGPNALYRNDRDGTFTDVALSAGIRDAGRANGGCAADYDNDGDQDLFITIYGGSRLYRNEADGTFTDVTASSLSDYDENFHRLYSSTGCAWGDYDRDGLLDLIVVRHISNEEPVVSKEGELVDLAGGVTLYHNDGLGAFKDVTRLLGDDTAPTTSLDPGRLGNVWGAGFQPIWIDFDNDGDQDIYVANDFGMHVHPNVLWRNDGLDEDGRWTFRDVSAGSGSDVPMYGRGVAVGDYDLDGFFDFYVTNIGNNVLLKNNGDGVSFTNVSRSAGAGVGIIGHTSGISWGALFFDYDNDGDEDLYVVNGYLTPTGFAEERDYEKEQPNVLLRNSGVGTFMDVSLVSGADDPGRGRGGAFLDYDQDGCLDLFVGNLGGSPRLYRNECTSGNNWLVVKTVGTTSNRDGIGARIAVEAGGARQIREIAAGSSSMSQNMMAAQFGLGKATKADLLTVRWPSGKVQTLADVPANQRITVVEP